MDADKAAKLREALCLLVDRQSIVDTIVQTGNQTANTFVSAGMSDGNGKEFAKDGYKYPDAEVNGYYSSSDDDYDANYDQAVELLKSIGYKFNDDGTLSDSTPISFTYLINNAGAHQAIAESIQQDWAQIGIDIKIQAEDWNVFLEDRKKGNFTVARDGWIADYDDPVNMLEMWTSDSGNNNAQLGKDPSNTAAPAWTDFDSLVTKIKSATDPTERATDMHKAEDMLMSTWAVAPLYYYNDIWMLKTNVTGVWDTKFGTKYFMYAKFN
jgi:peptide/nickel transport system substrate-binding protein/oligopeptide transport system substrate-binding protein